MTLTTYGKNLLELCTTSSPPSKRSCLSRSFPPAAGFTKALRRLGASVECIISGQQYALLVSKAEGKSTVLQQGDIG